MGNISLEELTAYEDGGTVIFEFEDIYENNYNANFSSSGRGADGIKLYPSTNPKWGNSK